MTQYIVHIYREMRLSYTGIEADSLEAAAAIARDKPTSDADDIEDCDGETLTALVDVAGDEEYEQSQFIDFEAERQRKAAPALLASLRAVLPYAENECRSLAECGKRDGDPVALAEATACEQAISAAQDAIVQATIDGPPWKLDAPSARSQPYSVLLLYPDYANDGGTETYYAFVEAADPLDAVAVAQRQAVAAQDVEIDDPADFAPLLVTQGHHTGQPLFNK